MAELSASIDQAGLTQAQAARRSGVAQPRFMARTQRPQFRSALRSGPSTTGGAEGPDRAQIRTGRA
jgi:hypothetical protein